MRLFESKKEFLSYLKNLNFFRVNLTLKGLIPTTNFKFSSPPERVKYKN